MDSVFACKVQDPAGITTKHLLLYPGISGRGLQQALQAAFSLGQSEVAGLLDPKLDIFFPLSLFAKAPKYLASREPYRVIGAFDSHVAADGTVQHTTSVRERSALEQGARHTEFQQVCPIHDDTSDTLPQPHAFDGTTLLRRRSAGIFQAESSKHDTLTRQRAVTAGIPGVMYPGLEDLRAKMQMSQYPTEGLLEALAAIVANDGKLTRAEFNSALNDFAPRLGFAAPSTANEAFGLFDEANRGVLRYGDVAAGLAILCKGPLARSTRCAYQFYQGRNDDMDLAKLIAFAASTFKVLYAASPEHWDRLQMSPQELATVVASEYCNQKRVSWDGRVHVEDFSNCVCFSTIEGGMETVNTPEFGGNLVQPLASLHQRDTLVLLELLSAYADGDGAVSLPSIYGCIRTLLEVDRNEAMSNVELVELKAILKKVFGALDTSKNGTLPYRDLTSGVSVFLRNDRDAMVRPAFDIYGNNEGCVTVENTRSYFSAIFKVLSMIDESPLGQTRHGIPNDCAGAARLAENAVEHAFDDAASTVDGKMSFNQLCRWYSRRGAPPVRGGGRQEFLDVNEIHSVFKFRETPVAGVVKNLTGAAGDGIVTWSQFLRFMYPLADPPSDEREAKRVKRLSKRLFDVFDEDGCELVDLCVLASGISILCKGSWPDRMSSLFVLLHDKRHGSINRGDMRTYFSAAFKLICSAAPAVVSKTTPSTPASIAKADAFAAAIDDEGKEPEQFGPAIFFGLHSKTEGSTQGPSVGGIRGLATMEYAPSADLERASYQMRLNNISAATAFDLFRCALDEHGAISKPVIHRCFDRTRQLADRQENYGVNDVDKFTSAENEERIEGIPEERDIIDRLYDALEVERSGQVDFHELAGGLSVLCGGSRTERMRAVFETSSQGQGVGITEEALRRYLASAFRVMYMLQPDLKNKMGLTPEELGRFTCLRAFEDIATDQDGHISLHDFESWFSSTAGGAPAPGANCEVVRAKDPAEAHHQLDQAKGHREDMLRARKILCLDCFNVHDLMEMFAEVAIMGTLSLDNFWRCMIYVLQLGGLQEGTLRWRKASVLAQRIYRAFEDGNEAVDFAAITSGVSILCQSSVDAKMLVAFTLFDVDCDGKLNLEEVAMYMASVLRVAIAVSRGDTEDTVDPGELGASLAASCFKQAGLSGSATVGADDFRRFIG